jgi:hypothetical protein
LIGALIGAFSAGAFYGIGQGFQGLHRANIDSWAAASGDAANGIMDSLHTFGGLELTSGQIAGQIASHAVAGGVISDLAGGKFGHGFFAAGFTKGVGTSINGTFNNGPISGTLSNMVIGGSASVISGGKFANGARTAAYQSLFNEFSYKLKSMKLEVENARKHPSQTEYSTSERLGVFEAGAKLLIPDDKYFADSIAARFAAKAALGVSVFEGLGTVNVTTTRIFQHYDDKWNYEFDVFDSGRYIGTENMFRYHINYTSGNLVNTQMSFSDAKYFWNEGY